MRFAIALMLCCSTASAASFEDAKAATCKLGGCSGVHVGGGVVLTVEHCGEQTKAVFGGVSHRLTLDYEPVKNGVDESKRLRANPIPAVGVQIGQPPKAGDVVYTIGYPGEQTGRQQWQMASGTVASTGSKILVRVGLFGGHSGGPLFNEQWQLIGLTSSSNRKDLSVFIPVTHAKYTRKPKLLIFGKGDCVACTKFKQQAWSDSEFRGRIQSKYDVEFVDVETPEGRALATKCQVTSIPVFIEVAGLAFRVIHTGYTTIRSLHVAIWGEIAAPAEPSTRVNAKPLQSSPTPIEPIPAEPDWSHVRVVVMIPKVATGRISGIASGVAISRLSGPVRRAIYELSDGKATIDIVSQRNEPERYNAVADAAGADGLRIIALVKRQPVGLVKGIFAAKIERKINDLDLSIPVETIFERSWPAEFAAVETALDEPLPEPQSNEPDGEAIGPAESSYRDAGGLWGLAGVVLGIIGARFGHAKSSKVETAPVAAEAAKPEAE